MCAPPQAGSADCPIGELLMTALPVPGVAARPDVPRIAGVSAGQLPPDVQNAPMRPETSDTPRSPAGAEPDVEAPTTGAPPVPVADVPSPDWDIVDEWGAQSFPASDPPANW